MKKLCLLSFLIIIFLLLSSTSIFAQHSTCGSGLPWEDCGPHTCTPGGQVVEQWCCPSCGSPDFCQDKPQCPGYSYECDNVSQCSFPDCPGGSCATMECIDHLCISDCVPCEPDGGTPTPVATPTPVTPCKNITYMLSPSPPVLVNTPMTVNISRIGATNCFGNWNWVGLLLDGTPQGVGLCYADGVTNCAQGYHSYINSDGAGSHTLQFTVNSGTCLCNPYSFTTRSCVCGPWQDVACGDACGGLNCSKVEMCQVQYCSWSDGSGSCDTNWQCVSDPICVPPAWFQTRDGDVHGQTDIYDPISADASAGPYCSLPGDGGYPGVVSYGTSYNFGDDGSASERGWLANSSQGTTYGYEYFDGLIDDDDGDPVLADGKPTSGIYKISGDQSITSNWNVGSTESYVFLIDNGKLTINGNINVALGGFIAFIVDGDIEIGESVISLEGIYIANKEIETSGQNNTQLSAEGTFVGWEKVPLRREFIDESLNDTTPVENFVFRPDLWINAPKELLKSSYTWQELAP